MMCRRCAEKKHKALNMAAMSAASSASSASNGGGGGTGSVAVEKKKKVKKTAGPNLNSLFKTLAKPPPPPTPPSSSAQAPAESSNRRAKGSVGGGAGGGDGAAEPGVDLLLPELLLAVQEAQQMTFDQSPSSVPSGKWQDAWAARGGVALGFYASKGQGNDMEKKEVFKVSVWGVGCAVRSAGCGAWGVIVRSVSS